MQISLRRLSPLPKLPEPIQCTDHILFFITSISGIYGDTLFVLFFIITKEIEQDAYRSSIDPFCVEKLFKKLQVVIKFLPRKKHDIITT